MCSFVQRREPFVCVAELFVAGYSLVIAGQAAI